MVQLHLLKANRATQVNSGPPRRRAVGGFNHGRSRNTWPSYPPPVHCWPILLMAALPMSLASRAVHRPGRGRGRPGSRSLSPLAAQMSIGVVVRGSAPIDLPAAVSGNVLFKTQREAVKCGRPFASMSWLGRHRIAVNNGCRGPTPNCSNAAKCRELRRVETPFAIGNNRAREARITFRAPRFRPALMLIGD